ncbi:AAA family ATPase [Cryobacterium sp. M15]|uniref:AAA family ATPase n=1 Tax=Cryobacterium sp. M15 TaxID=2048291 RepID=UPI000CE31357|nr:AAA family ATPase [Cryobacterium sp. M15]
MLTKLEADGFKNLLDFSVEFGPYTCIAGANAVGKSNVFDAIEFLALLADHPFMEAAQRLRSAGDRGGDPKTLFWHDGSEHVSRMKLAAEMIVPWEVEDDFGRQESPTTSFLRYEVELEYQAPDVGSAARIGRIVLISEELRHIKTGDAAQHLRWKHNKKMFRDAVVKGRRSGTAYISTIRDDDAEGVVQVHQDGGSSGQPRTSPAARAPRSIVSTTTTSDTPTILAARREMQQWRKLALEPSAMRSPDNASGPTTIGSDGAHLASTLYRLASRESDDVYSEIASSASALTDLRDVRVDVDPQRDTLTLYGQLGIGPYLPARALSDGTLRFLALCIIEHDSEFGGVICMEEPENGIHPAKIEAMVELLKSLAVDPTVEPGLDNPFRQVIVNTHSPYFVALQDDNDLLVAYPASILRDGREQTTVRLLPMKKSWRSSSHGYVGSKASIVDYLRFPEKAQQPLEYADRKMDL